MVRANLIRLFLPEKTNLPVIQGLRGIAALAVAWFHLSAVVQGFNFGIMSRSGYYGYLGVDVFFVISGFILPYTMYRAGYSVRNFWGFMAKRLIRVEPPYLLSIALTISLWAASQGLPSFKGGPVQVSWTQLALHLGYLIPYFPKYHWLNVVYWTLAVELQYYVVLSLTFPFLISRNPAIRIPACLLFAGSSLFIQNNGFLPQLAPIFLVGIAGMLRMSGLASWLEFAGVVLIAAGLGYKSTSQYEVLAALAALTCIMLVKSVPAPLLLIGDLSYSLYLLHEIIGRRVIHLASRFCPPRFAEGLPVLALLVSIGAAFLLYRGLELPAKRLAGKIRYKQPLLDDKKILISVAQG